VNDVTTAVDSPKDLDLHPGEVHHATDDLTRSAFDLTSFPGGYVLTRDTDQESHAANDEEAARPHGIATREQLAQARILLVGLEPWGIVAAIELAAAGLGAIHVLDDGSVTDDDLLAVRLFTDADRGRTRVAALGDVLARTAPGCMVSSSPLLASANRALVVDDGRWDLVLSCVPGDDLLVLQAAARLAHASGAISLGAHLDGLEAVIGPGVIPGETACWNCCRLRLLANSARAGADHALQVSLLAERPRPRARTYLSPTAGLLGHALAPAVLDLLATRGASPLAGRLLIRSLVTLKASLHTVLRLPACDVCGGARESRHDGAAPDDSGVRLDAARDPAELRRMLAGIVDARTGIVNRLELDSHAQAIHPDAPRTATATLGTLPDGHCCAHRCGEPGIGAGKGITPVDAMIRAVGEAVERYSAGRFERGAQLRASVAEMAETKVDHLAPERLCLYEESQYARPDFPYVRLDDATRIDWALGRWLDTGSPVYVPSLPTFYDYPAIHGEAFCQVTSNGLAAGATLTDASMRAAVELIERDAFMISWLARLPGRRILIDESVDAATREVVRQLAERGARTELYLVDVGLAVPTVVAVGFGDGKRWPGAAVAMAAHLGPHAAIRKAILELGHVGPYLRRLMLEGKQTIPDRPEDVHTLDDHAFYYFPPSRAHAFDFLGRGGATHAADLEEPEDLSLAALVHRIRAAGQRIAVVDVTSPDLATSPFRVARALGPDFQQIHFGHVLGRLGNPRLRAMAPHGINTDPHPMA
jgi:ribosomal protein S12 methylthiotransferase accessory factor